MMFQALNAYNACILMFTCVEMPMVLLLNRMTKFYTEFRAETLLDAVFDVGFCSALEFLLKLRKCEIPLIKTLNRAP